MFRLGMAGGSAFASAAVAKKSVASRMVSDAAFTPITFGIVSSATVLATATPTTSAGITSTSFTPSPGAVVVVASFNTGSSGSNVQGTIVSTHSPGLLWYEPRVIGGGNTTGAVRWWWTFVPTESGTGAGTVTVTLPSAPSIQNLVVFEVLGADELDPIVGQGNSVGTTATSLNNVLGVAPTLIDSTFLLAMNRNKATPPTVQVGSGFADKSSAASTNPSASYLVGERRNSTSTAAGVDNLGPTWSALETFVIRAGPGVAPPSPGYDIYIWDGVSLASSPMADPYWWDGTTLQPLDFA